MAKGKPAKDKHPGGAPTKYLPEYCQQMVEYFDATPTLEQVIAKKTTNGLIEFPTFERFASKVGVTMNTIYNWCKEYPEFLLAYEKSKQMQKSFLMQAGLNELYNAGFAKFVAINCTDMRDKTETELSGEISTRVTITVDDSQVKI